MEPDPAPFVHLHHNANGLWFAHFDVDPEHPWRGDFVGETPRKAVVAAVLALGLRARGVEQALDEVDRLERAAQLGAGETPWRREA